MSPSTTVVKAVTQKGTAHRYQIKHGLRPLHAEKKVIGTGTVIITFIGISIQAVRFGLTHCNISKTKRFKKTKTREQSFRKSKRLFEELIQFRAQGLCKAP